MNDIIEEFQSRFDNVEAVVSGYSMQVVWAGPKIHKLLGYDEGELTNASVGKLVKINPISVTKMIVDAVNDEADDTNKVTRKDGSEFLMKTTAEITKYENEPYVVVTSAEALEE